MTKFRVAGVLIKVLVPAAACFAGPLVTPVNAAPADSTEIVEEVLSREGIGESEAEAVADALNLEGYSGGPKTGRLDGAFLTVETLAGYRKRYKAVGSPGAAVPGGQFGLQCEYDRWGGFAGISGAGPLKKLAVGGVRPVFGEGLLLGARKSPFRSPGACRMDPGITVSSTSSVWSGRNGAAVSVGSAAYTASAVAWEETDTSHVYWSALSAKGATGGAGIAAGVRRFTHGGNPRYIGTTVYVVGPLPGVFVSGEFAGFGGRWFAAVRARSRDGGPWNVHVFTSPVPDGYSGGAVAAGDENREQRGCELHRIGKWRGMNTRLSLYTNVRYLATSTLHRRRWYVSTGGRTGDYGRWSGSVRWSDELETAYPEEKIDYRPADDRQRQVTARTGWTGASRGVLRQRYRLSVSVDGGGSASLVGVMGWKLVFRCFEAGFQVNNYSMATGRTGFVVRPGFSGGEAISAVTRTGSDVSANVRVGIRGVRAAVFWARPWGKAPRMYTSVRISL